MSGSSRDAAARHTDRRLLPGSQSADPVFSRIVDKGGPVSHPQNYSLPEMQLTRLATRLADEVSHLLRDLILRGQLAPGTPLLQVQLAERLGVSRTPLREAFRILERDGLLRISNGNKTVEVIELDRQHLIETYQVREVIDGLAARLAAAHGLSERSANRMEQAIDRME